MKNVLRASGLICAIAVLSLSLSTSPVYAGSNDKSSDAVRTVQMRLASFGYYVGRYDGVMGPITERAIMSFQQFNGIPMNGQLDQETYNLLMYSSSLSYGDRDYYRPAYHPVVYGYDEAPHVVWDDRWTYAHSEQIPTRFGRLDMSEDDRGSLRHYSITFNGRPVLFANNQPGILRVSKTFMMNDEDNIIFTAYNGDSSCTYKNYLLTIHRDGSFTMPLEISNCSAAYEARVDDNTLFVSFPSSPQYDSISTWDVWRYRDHVLVRL